MTYQTTLPFPRGKTACGGVLTADATIFKNLEGKVFEVPDTQHKYGSPVKLRVVRNASGSAITVTKGKLYKFATGAGETGGQIAGLNTTAGGVCKPIDDAYAASFSIPANDLFYVVEAGRCDVLTCASTTGAALYTTSGIGAQMQCSAGSVLAETAAAAGDFVLGILDQTCATTSTLVRVNILEGLRNDV